MIDPRQTLGDLVTANPDRARALEALDLDYCCGGRRTLAEAAAEAGRDLSEVVAALDAVGDRGAGAEATWTYLQPEALLDHIVATHHAFLRAEAPRVLALGRKVLGVHGDRHPELAAVVGTFEQLWAELEAHLDDEEVVEFPAIRAALDGGQAPEGAAPDLVQLRADHEAAGSLLDRLRQETADFAVPDDGCASYQAFYDGLALIDRDTRLHVHKENNVVFPAFERALARA